MKPNVEKTLKSTKDTLQNIKRPPPSTETHSNIRVIQKNIVYVVGLTSDIAQKSVNFKIIL